MNHFIKVTDVDGTEVAFRPDHISIVVDNGDDVFEVWFTNGKWIRIPRGQVAFDLIPVRCSHAGVRKL